MKKTLLLVMGLLIYASSIAQPTYPVNGVHDERDKLYAFTNATIYTQYNKKVDKATLVIKDGKIIGVGTGVTIPKGAIVTDLAGKFIYPSFIDIFTNYGLPEPEKKKRSWTDPPKFTSDKRGAYGWNEAVKPEYEAHKHFSANGKAATDYRNLGFGAVLSHQKDGIARGTGTVVLLGKDSDHELFIKDKATAHYSFSKGSSTQDYPSSLMGSIALLRQTFLDADWYKRGGKKKEYNITLDSWNNTQDLPQIFDAGDWQSILRADKIGDEFETQYIIKSNGDTYKRIEDIKATGASLIVSLNFPKAYDVEDPFDALNVSVAQMKHWELAPTNPVALEKAGVNFALTAADLKDKKSFSKALQKAIEHGLSKEAALKALTHTPANLIGVGDKVGSLEKGKIANFIITSTDIFEEKASIQENWIAGHKHVIKAWKKQNLIATYDLKVGALNYTLEASGKPEKTKLAILINDSTKIDVKHTLQEKSISLGFATAKDSIMKTLLGDGYIRLSGWVSDDSKTWTGKGKSATGEWIKWTATYKEVAKKKEEEKKKDDKPAEKKADTNKEEKTVEQGKVTYPFLAYGWTEKPKAGTVLFKNATVWTNEKEGILENTDVLIKDGKIAKIGKDLTAPSGSKTVDAKGKHLTCGIVDEHSHIAISKGVNEGTQASSAEVRIGDVVNSEDVNLYRQLAGGVTTSQLLHGSANPIGGQSAIIKFRWGATPEQMKFENADGFIKFALGENVKQSNWGENNTVRFPQTRMGVEQVYMDGFTRAAEYGKALNNRKLKKTLRKDLELEALWEIMNKKRFITCHSYVQSEINMLMKVAEKFDFNINTFTHILEGYKVADKMKEHGVAGSTFADWWAYKYEVIDAIPHNGAILHEKGVLTGFNSDDAEMARRLNQEAAKAVKYGGVSEEEAWKFVTLNPAKMLHLDKRVGSIKTGKDADIVLWTDNPLSVYAKAAQTYVDGICYFDLEKDKVLRQELAKERNRLIQKMIAFKKNGGKTQKPKPTKQRLYHCDDMGE